MRIFVPKEKDSGESRVPLVPEIVDKLVKLGASVEIESGLGESIKIADSDYIAAGATISHDRQASLSSAGIVLRLNGPPLDEIPYMKEGCIHISHLDPFNNTEAVRKLAGAGITAISLEMVPRSTIAQKMDALSSQANLAGYVAVIVAAERLSRIFPMMMTPAGTISPTRVFVVGVGVAGLQAIATAKRLGARVSAFDVRPEVEEQVKSLGAKFVKVDLGETGQTEQGYAKQLTQEQLQKQRDAMAKQCALSDVVITTAQVFGKKAPVIVTTDMVRGMKPGSIIVDLSVETGGNVEGSRRDEEVFIDGVRVIGLSNPSRQVPVHASQMYSSNLGNFIEHFWDKESGKFKLDLENDILKRCVITHGREVYNEAIRNLLG